MIAFYWYKYKNHEDINEVIRHLAIDSKMS
nr:MAG TPA: hypothetical protein [Caudoviricetes sp.]